MAERPEDLNLPNSIVSKIIRDTLPPNCKVSKEASIAIAKAASVFVLYATSCSNNVSVKANRKTITGQDVMKAVEDMEFDKFLHPLNLSWEAWKEKKREDGEMKKQKQSKQKELLNKSRDEEGMDNNHDEKEEKSNRDDEDKENDESSPQDMEVIESAKISNSDFNIKQIDE